MSKARENEDKTIEQQIQADFEFANELARQQKEEQSISQFKEAEIDFDQLMNPFKNSLKVKSDNVPAKTGHINISPEENQARKEVSTPDKSKCEAEPGENIKLPLDQDFTHQQPNDADIASSEPPKKPLDFPGFNLNPKGLYRNCPDGENSPLSTFTKETRCKQDSDTKDNSVWECNKVESLAEEEEKKYTEIQWMEVVQKLERKDEELQKLKDELAKEKSRSTDSEEIVEVLKTKEEELERIKEELDSKNRIIKQQSDEIEMLRAQLLGRRDQYQHNARNPPSDPSSFSEQNRRREGEKLPVKLLSPDDLAELLLYHQELLMVE